MRILRLVDFPYVVVRLRCETGPARIADFISGGADADVADLKARDTPQNDAALLDPMVEEPAARAG